MKEIVVVLHNIRSLHNVGSVFRTADAAGVSKIYLCGITPKPVDPLGNYRREIAKVALGAERTVPWEYSRSTAALLKKLRKAGYTIFAVEQSAKSVPYYALNPKRYARARVALIVGNEVEGLPAGILHLADKILEIPMQGKKESLNVSVAFGIVVFRLVYNK
jgi:tRNA G18 (ribose-2'-O)-methylase SpoU